jgi:hypothetical protein
VDSLVLDAQQIFFIVAMPSRRLLLIAALPALLALPQTASAQVAGPDQGVTAAHGAHGIVIRFGKRAAETYRRIAGRRIKVSCETVSRNTGGYGYSVEGGMEMAVRAPRKRGRIPTFDRRRADICTVRLRKAGDEVVAAAPLTARGRAFLDELGIASLISGVLELGDPDGTPAPAADLVAQGHGVIVALDGPDGTPPRGKAGYWTDGVRVVVAGVSAAGRRLFIELERDVIRTNVLGYIASDPY